jgi:hypothetical protein
MLLVAMAVAVLISDLKVVCQVVVGIPLVQTMLMEPMDFIQEAVVRLKQLHQVVQV